jgi:hypothetical protein
LDSTNWVDSPNWVSALYLVDIIDLPRRSRIPISDNVRDDTMNAPRCSRISISDNVRDDTMNAPRRLLGLFYIKNTEIDVTYLLEEEKKIMSLVKRTGYYFHGKAGENEGLRVFVIVRDFLIMLDKACKQVKFVLL